MMRLSESEAYLLRKLRDAPQEHGYRYTKEAEAAVLQELFNALACHRKEYLRLLFPAGVPLQNSPEAWKLTAAQGAVEGAEYSTAARGKRCGHIFRNGEATYRCKTCAVDDTCVLCSKCFEGSDHEGHAVYVSISSGSSGCCDCGDDEAWRLPVMCAIHTADTASPMETDGDISRIPPDLVEGIRSTISRALDYVCDVISCSPEQLRLPKTEALIKKDEDQSRLTSPYYYPETETDNVEYALILWNDEKHTVEQVQQQLMRACRQTKKFGLDCALEVDAIGRCVVKYDTDIRELIRVSRIIEHIKVTVTVRSSRDTFREQMCGTIIEWLEDISGCSVGDDNEILRSTICEELLGVWRVGSKASNTKIGKFGIDDHSSVDERENASFTRRFVISVEPLDIAEESEDMEVDNEGDGEENEDDEDEDEDIGDQDDLDEDDFDMVRSDNVNSDDDGGILGDRGFSMRDMLLRSIETTRVPNNTGDSEEDGAPKIPTTPNVPSRKRTGSYQNPPAPRHWLEKPSGYASRQPLPPYEDLRQRVRLDWLIMFDLRLWKKARNGLRDLYIGTVVAVPEFKRILGLRFAGLYTALSQLYLIADREPEHSIINLSLQILTAPSITAEVVKKGNFLTILMAILYTFLTTRQVGYPHQVNREATLAFDGGTTTNPLTNRRMYHFFHDMRHLLGTEYVQDRLTEEARYTLQFLDLVRLHQGICPNVRAVNEHLEYEAEAWISAAVITREINKLSRLFAEAFSRGRAPFNGSLLRAIASTAKYATASSMGWERHRGGQVETRVETQFKSVQGFINDIGQLDSTHLYKVVLFSVDNDPISFHHALHYTLSWLVEAGKHISVENLRTILLLDSEKIMHDIPNYTSVHEPEDLALAMFDMPLRVCAWLAQMKTGMWVRNGFSLRHQMQTYRSVSQRDLTHNRDIFLLQVSLVVLNQSRMLVNMVDRFGLTDWMTGNYKAPTDYEEAQMLDLLEELLHLLIVILSDRLSLIPLDEEPNLPLQKIRRELVHILCFKPMQFSELARHLPERLLEHERFQEVLASMTKYRPPDGLSDYGTFELNEEFLDEVDPYVIQFTKNQREETESNYKTRIAKKSAKREADVVFEPRLRPIRTGLFSGMTAFTSVPVFAQIIFYSFAYCLQSGTDIPDTRIDTFLQLGLHLCLLAVTEDKTVNEQDTQTSFVMNALNKEFPLSGDPEHRTIASVLYYMSHSDNFKACRPKINHILRSMKQKKPSSFINYVQAFANEVGDKLDIDEDNSKEAEAERKKILAKERQARIMEQMKQQQQSFMDTAGINFGDDLSDAESDLTLPAETSKSVWKYPTGTCILCQEEMNDTKLYGTLALVTESNLLRQTDPTDAEYLHEVVQTPESLDRSAQDIRPFGVASMNRQSLKKLAADGTEVYVQRQGLGRGFPHDKVRTGPVAVGCSHHMHFSCFEHYYENARRRHPNQVARNHPENLALREFVCPLCKALGNAFLPIIWKAKEEVFNFALQTELSFEGWLAELGPTVSRLGKVVEGGDMSKTRNHELFYDYAHTNLVGPIATKLHEPLPCAEDSILSNLSTPIGSGASPIPSLSHRPPQSQMGELQKAYQRLRDTFRDNNIPSDFSHDDTFRLPMGLIELTYCDSLARTLGFSISAIEIAQRGIASEPGSTLLDRISTQTLTHLRILSETVSSYYALGILNNEKPVKTVREFKSMENEQLRKLFVGHQYIFDDDVRSKLASKVDPLLSEDIFVFLAQCSVCLVPSMSWDIMHVIRLCYMAEIIKAVLVFGNDCDLLAILRQWEGVERLGEIEGRIGYTERQLQLLQRFGKFVGQSCGAVGSFDDVSSFALAVFRHLVGTYTTPFLRKCVLLLYTRYGVLFPPSGFAESDLPEQTRLCTSLQLPSVDGVFEACLSDSGEGEYLRSIISGWCHHASHKRLKINISHPSIFELVALPLHYDVLVDEAMKRRCPTTGKDITDPAICLFCGEIFCSQAVCCIEKVGDDQRRIGGCNRHVQKCGGNVGLFINIRKCGLLYLHNYNGTWAETPYMDAHGETDLGLRRNRQLFLNQRRYDALVRDVWLKHGIPSVISRKLEADMNTGGWDTL